MPHIEAATFAERFTGMVLEKRGLSKRPLDRHVLLISATLTLEPGRRYAEAEVNEIIGRYHEDYCTLRRELIMARLLEREQGVYWRRP